ncbi:MAG: DUF815 domain-containing protein [Candidatus Zeuxoniibacter abyssi]|nr:MAG: DUF815 domain-containing protein [Candidatus Persebacteraceae bacterium AB1(2)]
MSSKRIADALERLATLGEKLAGVCDGRELDNGKCWRWEAATLGGRLHTIEPSAAFDLKQLLGIDKELSRIEKNTRQFLRGKPAHHVLISGPRGCGKSSAARGLFSKYAKHGLRLIETDKWGLSQLSSLSNVVAQRREKYIIFCDDLSLSNEDHFLPPIKSALEGALSSNTDNLRVYATSNRRHLMPEMMAENQSTVCGEEIHPQETGDEKIALSDRFGLSVSFFAPDVAEFENLVRHWLKNMKVSATPQLMLAACRYADERGSISGRIARQFAISVANKN